jgi:hypothetical protein
MQNCGIDLGGVAVLNCIRVGGNPSVCGASLGVAAVTCIAKAANTRRDNIGRAQRKHEVDTAKCLNRPPPENLVELDATVDQTHLSHGNSFESPLLKALEIGVDLLDPLVQDAAIAGALKELIEIRKVLTVAIRKTRQKMKDFFKTLGPARSKAKSPYPASWPRFYPKKPKTGNNHSSKKTPKILIPKQK